MTAKASKAVTPAKKASCSKAAKFVCDIKGCKEELKSAKLLMQHKKAHELKSLSKTFKCPFRKCKHVAVDVTELEMHRMLAHGGQKAYQCTQCDYGSDLPGSLIHHRRTEHGSPSKQVRFKESTPEPATSNSCGRLFNPFAEQPDDPACCYPDSADMVLCGGTSVFNTEYGLGPNAEQLYNWMVSQQEEL